MKKNTESVVIRLPADVKEKLTSLAEADGVGLSTYIRSKLFNLLKKQEDADKEG
jgi:predicted DNA-binding protein